MKAAIVWGATIARFVAAATVVPLAVAGAWSAVFVVMIAAFGTDFIDGWLARRWGLVSRAGALWDPLADKAICLVVLALLGALWQPWYWALFAVFAVYDTSTTALRLLLTRPMPASGLAKYKTAVQMGGLLVLVGGLVARSAAFEALGSACLVIAAVLAMTSLFRYVGTLAASAHWLEQPRGVAELDFAKWHDHYGITTVLFDIEGTLTPWRSVRVDSAVASALARARQYGVTHFGLVSNMPTRYSSRAADVARQIGAQTYHVPHARNHRKPSSYMVEAALKRLHSLPDRSGFAGDKIVDVLAAHRAGVARVAWVRRLGTADHPFDKLVYRPLERMLRWAIRSGARVSRNHEGDQP